MTDDSKPMMTPLIVNVTGASLDNPSIPYTSMRPAATLFLVGEDGTPVSMPMDLTGLHALHKVIKDIIGNPLFPNSLGKPTQQ